MDICKVEGCLAECKLGGMCVKHHARMRRHGHTEETSIRGDDLRRIMSSYDIDDNGCWIWNKCIYRGYGRIRTKSMGGLAHRVAWTLLVGEIPKGMNLNHKCHVKSCINPGHLYVGTQKENVEDMWRAERGNSGSNASSNETVLEIRKRVKSGDTQRNIAKEFGISQTAVSRIVNNKSYKWAQ